MMTNSTSTHLIEKQKSSWQKISESWTLKILVLLFMALLLSIPTLWIDGLISERRVNFHHARNSVESMWGGKQTIGTPVIGIPYVYGCGTKEEPRTCSGVLYRFPENLETFIKIQSKSRTKGIFEIPLYSSQVKMKFDFKKPNFKDIAHIKRIQWEDAKVIFSMENTKGLLSSPQLKKNKHSEFMTICQDRDVPFEKSLCLLADGFSQSGQESQTYEIEFEVNGSQELNIVTSAGENNVHMSSDWAHPEFIGFQLPTHREVNESGFSSQWKVSAINHLQPKQFLKIKRVHQKVVGFHQYIPVSHYTQIDRAIKYAKLFILLTFVFCFFTEVKSGCQIHFINYALVGFSLLTFFVLLLSLSEHIGFQIAYWVATGAVVIQLGRFLWKVLQGTIPGKMASVFIVSLYSFLYFILQSEDYALLAGSGGLFIILSGVMYLSSRMNWNQTNEK